MEWRERKSLSRSLIIITHIKQSDETEKQNEKPKKIIK